MSFNPGLPYNNLPLLPPSVNLETKTVLKAAISANVALARLREAGKTIPNQDILISSIPLLEAAASSEIENIFTTTDTLYRAITIPQEQTDPQTKEVLNYRKALYKGFNYLKEGKRPDTELFEMVCSTILGKKTGRREIGVYIGNRYMRAYTPPDDPEVIDELLEQFLEYFLTDSEIDPLIRLSLAHYQFEAIHPFLDGNGRTGRVINILFLVHLGILDIPVLYLSRYIIRNKGDYYAKLNAVTAKGEWENWVLYMLDAIRDTADWTYSRINLIRELMVSTRDLCRENLPKNVYSHELIEQIFLQPYCKPAHLVEAGIGHRQTAMKYLKELERIGVLQSQKIGRDRIYVNVRLYELLKYDSSETNKSYS